MSARMAFCVVASARLGVGVATRILESARSVCTRKASRRGERRIEHHGARAQRQRRSQAPQGARCAALSSAEVQRPCDQKRVANSVIKDVRSPNVQTVNEASYVRSVAHDDCATHGEPPPSLLPSFYHCIRRRASVARPCTTCDAN